MDWVYTSVPVVHEYFFLGRGHCGLFFPLLLGWGSDFFVWGSELCFVRVVMISALSELDVHLAWWGTVLFVGGSRRVGGDVFGDRADSAIFGSLPVAVFLSFGVIFVFDVCSVVEVVGA